MLKEKGAVQIRDNVFLSFVLAGSSEGMLFEPYELEAKTRPRFGRNWWYWTPNLTSNGGRFKSHKTTDISFHFLCLCISLTVYSWKEKPRF